MHLQFIRIILDKTPGPLLDLIEEITGFNPPDRQDRHDLETRLNPRSYDSHGLRILAREILCCHCGSRACACSGQVDAIHQGQGGPRRRIIQQIEPINEGESPFGISGKHRDQLCAHCSPPSFSRPQTRRHVENDPTGEVEMGPWRDGPSSAGIVDEGPLHGLNDLFHCENLFQIIPRNNPHHPIALPSVRK